MGSAQLVTDAGSGTPVGVAERHPLLCRRRNNKYSPAETDRDRSINCAAGGISGRRFPTPRALSLESHESNSPSIGECSRFGPGIMMRALETSSKAKSTACISLESETARRLYSLALRPSCLGAVATLNNGILDVVRRNED